MRPKRLLICGALAIGSAAPFAFACGDNSFENANDASVSEAATSDVVASDAGIFCNSQTGAALCVDFDEVDLRNGFQFGAQKIIFAALGGTGGGIIGAADAGLSPPTALETALPVDAGPATDADVESATATGLLSPLTGATHFRLECDLRFNQIGVLTGSSLVLTGMQFGGPLGYTVYIVDLHDGHVYVEAFSSLKQGSSIDLGSVPAAGPSWVHLVIDIAAGINGKLSGSLGTGQVASAASLLDRTEVTPTLSIGPSTSGGTGIIDVSFDNLLLFADAPDAGLSVGTDADVIDAADD